MNFRIKLAKLSFISIQISFHFDDQFFVVYLKTKLLRINLKAEHCGAFFLHLTLYDKNLKKIDYKRYRTIKSIFFKFISFCVDIFCLSFDIISNARI